EAGERLGGPLQISKRDPAIEKGFEVIRLDGQRLVVVGERLLSALERVEDDGIVQECGRKIGICSQRRADQRKRLEKPPLLVAQETEHLQRIEMVRPRIQQLQIQSFGGGELP